MFATLTQNETAVSFLPPCPLALPMWPNVLLTCSSNIPVRRLCGCLDEADVFTSGTDDNPCRRFYRCPNRKVKDCGLFDWIDPALPEFQRTCFIRLKAEKKALEEKLRAMEKQHNDRSGVKE
ncbi:GRF zinc finger containing protein, partial [Striga asiatica]